MAAKQSCLRAADFLLKSLFFSVTSCLALIILVIDCIERKCADNVKELLIYLYATLSLREFPFFEQVMVNVNLKYENVSLSHNIF